MNGVELYYLMQNKCMLRPSKNSKLILQTVTEALHATQFIPGGLCLLWKVDHRVFKAGTAFEFHFTVTEQEFCWMSKWFLDNIVDILSTVFILQAIWRAVFFTNKWMR